MSFSVWRMFQSAQALATAKLKGRVEDSLDKCIVLQVPGMLEQAGQGGLWAIFFERCPFESPPDHRALPEAYLYLVLVQVLNPHEGA